MILEASTGVSYAPHPEGVFPAICVDVIDMGAMKEEFNGEMRVVRKLRVLFETGEVREDGEPFVLTKTFTASLHPKSKLSDCLGKWRGRPIQPGERIDMAKLPGACCTLVINHRQNAKGNTYASIETILKPTTKIAASGRYDPEFSRQRIAEWLAKQGQAGPVAAKGGAVVQGPKSALAAAAGAKEEEPEPEIGF